jgi:nucleotide-binding universal stress UspA family protein
MVRSGAPAEEITRAARETNADLIAIGTRIRRNSVDFISKEELRALSAVTGPPLP